MKTTNQVLILAGAALALFVAGRSSVNWGAPNSAVVPGEAHVHGAREAHEPSLWACPMHPQIKLPDFGICPICNMDLVELAGDSEDHPRRLVMSPASKALAQIASEPVRRRNVTRPVRLVGKVDYDETAIRTISAWVPGRIDRLYVDYTGVRVSEGDHLVWLYSPELLTAQEELLAAAERLETTAGERSEFLATSNRDAYSSAREKLLLWGLTEAQVTEIESRGTASDRVELTSPSSGVVIEKLLDEGAYVQTGTHIYRIADLSQLWLRLDAYEQDLAWLRHGQDVWIEVEALPGMRVQGVIATIDPYLDERTRTAKVRVNVDNRDGRLKPGMFVRAVANARLGAGGAVLDQQLAGKWVSPMHPEIVKDEPGQCDVCGMDLVRAEDLGLVPEAPSSSERPLVVPASAVLITGRRAVVYVDVAGTESPTFEGREVVLGPRAGDEYLVLEGLAEGERVVTNGAFRIDSSMQILAKPSMMGVPAEGGAANGPETTRFRASLGPIYAGYLEAQRQLANDEFTAAQRALNELDPQLEDVSAAGLEAPERELWREERGALAGALGSAAAARDLEELREAFEPASRSLLALARGFGHDGSKTLVEAYCPMALDGSGASWLQAGTEVANPYFGASMFRCGEIREEFQPMAGSTAPEHTLEHDHLDTSEEETALGAVFSTYLAVQQHLAGDDAPSAHSGLALLGDAVEVTTASSTWPESVSTPLRALHSALEELRPTADLEHDRMLFDRLSEQLLLVEAAAGNPLEQPLQVVHCPMAFENQGATWIQTEGSIANPYFGASMLRCGSVTREVNAR